jgi:hypothetical protein
VTKPVSDSALGKKQSIGSLHCELKPSQIFSFIPEHHAQRPDAQEKKENSLSDLHRHPPSSPPRKVYGNSGRDHHHPSRRTGKKGFTLGRRGYRSSTRLENNLRLRVSHKMQSSPQMKEKAFQSLSNSHLRPRPGQQYRYRARRSSRR